MPCMIDQNSAYDLRAESKKMRAVFALDAARANQLEIGLVSDGGRFKRLSTPPQVPASDLAQLRIHQYDERFQCRFVAVTPGHEHAGDILSLTHAGADSTK